MVTERQGKNWRVEKPGGYGGSTRFVISHVIARHRRLRPAQTRAWEFQFEMRHRGVSIITILGDSHVPGRERGRAGYDQESWFTVPQVPIAELQRQLQRGPVLVLDARVVMANSGFNETSEVTTIRMSKEQHAALSIWLDEQLEQGNLRGFGMLGGIMRGCR